MNLARFVLAACAVGALSACSSGTTSSAGGTVSSSSVAVSTVASSQFVMNGSILVHPSITITEEDGSCDAHPRLPISERVFVSISDEQNRKVGSATVGDGAWYTDGGCLFRFTATVDSPASFFEVQVGSEDPITISRQDAISRGFQVGYGYN
ncbi:hypothetical protein ACPCXD_17390 [Rhodococcus sp. AB351]|uniref:hypothetical protein n=1 Tax=Rhodococcus sp. AB351 TaxID=3413280 RepID=UPI003C265489